MKTLSALLIALAFLTGTSGIGMAVTTNETTPPETAAVKAADTATVDNDASKPASKTHKKKKTAKKTGTKKTKKKKSSTVTPKTVNN